MEFSKQKMIERLEREGRAHLITNEVTAIMDNLDGQEASASNWERQVKGAPLLWVIGKVGKGEYVNERDCE